MRLLSSYGKTYEECEKLLGKPTLVKDAKENAPEGARASQRHFKSSIPGITAIVLARLPHGGPGGPVPPTVNGVTYHFPKGTTWKKAFTLSGLNPDDWKIFDERKMYIHFRGKDESYLMWYFDDPDHEALGF